MGVKNYLPIIRSFLYQITKGGWQITAVYDAAGVRHFMGDYRPRKAKLLSLSEIAAGDESTVCFTKIIDGKAMHIKALIILGNEPDELVADWSYNDDLGDADFTKYWTNFTTVWWDKKVPIVDPITAQCIRLKPWNKTAITHT
jgi:hypothetical protein